MNSILSRTDLAFTTGTYGEIRSTIDKDNYDECFQGQFIWNGSQWCRHGLQKRTGRNGYCCVWYFDKGMQVNGPEGFYSQSASGGKVLYTTRVIGCSNEGNALIKDDGENKIYSIMPSSLTESRYIGDI